MTTFSRKGTSTL